jgi:hypothetical protein
MVIVAIDVVVEKVMVIDGFAFHYLAERGR